MIQFMGKYSHWLLLMLVGGSLLVSFFSGRYDGPSLAFGVLGLVGVAYLAYRIEADKRNKNSNS